MRRTPRPFYLRRTKEALVSFPDPDTGKVKKLFTKRNVQTVTFRIDSEEWDFYDALTRYVEDQSIRADAANSTPGERSALPWQCCSAVSPPAYSPLGEAWSACATSASTILEDPPAYRAGADRKEAS